MHSQPSRRASMFSFCSCLDENDSWIKENESSAFNFSDLNLILDGGSK
jgi:hypothetical protein